MANEKEQTAFDELTAWTLSRRDASFIHQHVMGGAAGKRGVQADQPLITITSGA